MYSTHCEADDIQAEGKTSVHAQGKPLSPGEDTSDESPVVNVTQLSAESCKNDALRKSQSCQECQPNRLAVLPERTHDSCGAVDQGDEI